MASGGAPRRPSAHAMWRSLTSSLGGPSSTTAPATFLSWSKAQLLLVKRGVSFRFVGALNLMFGVTGGLGTVFYFGHGITDQPATPDTAKDMGRISFYGHLSAFFLVLALAHVALAKFCLIGFEGVITQEGDLEAAAELDSENAMELERQDLRTQLGNAQRVLLAAEESLKIRLEKPMMDENAIVPIDTRTLGELTDFTQVARGLVDDMQVRLLAAERNVGQRGRAYRARGLARVPLCLRVIIRLFFVIATCSSAVCTLSGCIAWRLIVLSKDKAGHESSHTIRVCISWALILLGAYLSVAHLFILWIAVMEY